jgi:phosphatidylinositol alpha-1,6-mannosyltransferase
MRPRRAQLWIVTRKHPPAVGGMEELSDNVVRQLRRRRPVRVISWGRSQRWLPVFLARAAAAIVVGLMSRRISALLLGDPVLAVFGRLAAAAGVPVICVVHGLDVAWPNRAYQAYLRACFWRRFDAYVCISRHTGQLLLAGGVPEDKVFVVPVGVAAPPAVSPADIEGDPVLLFIGRLVPRKGLAWFVRQVLPRLTGVFPQLRLVVAGDGPERRSICKAAREAGVSAHMTMAGRVTDGHKWALLARCDAVVVPNVPVPGDVEGFGIVAVEAGAAGRPVFAADLEGLRDAVADGINGWRLPAADAEGWITAMTARLRDRSQLRAQGAIAREHVLRNFDWDRIGDRYAAVVDRLAPSM